MNSFIKKITSSVEENSPTILTISAIVGVVSVIVSAIHATPKAMDDIEEMEDETEEPTKMDYVKVAYKHYIPTAILAAGTIASILGANSIHAKRNGVLASAYGMATVAAKEYKEKVIEVIGKNKEQKVKSAVNQARLDKNPVTDANVIVTSKGEVLCFDKFSGRYFKSSIETIKSLENELNFKLLQDMEVSLNELYFALNLEEIPIGNDMGWNVNEGMVNIEFDSHLTPNNEPCLVLEYEVVPLRI